MPRGGKRPNSGRPKGAPNRATQERQAKVAAEGVTPLEVMVENMRRARQQAIDTEAALDLPGMDEAKEVLAKVAHDFRALAQTCARDAAPYVHPRLASVEHSGGVTVTHEEALDELERSGKGDPG